MATQITGKNIDLTDALKAHVEKRVSEFEKYGFDLIQVDVELDTSTHHNKGEDVHHARMNVKVPHEFFHAEAEKADMYSAIDKCRDEIEKQLRHLKTKYAAKQREANQAQREMKSAV
jgi:ribosomal subunit interface protein